MNYSDNLYRKPLAGDEMFPENSKEFVKDDTDDGGWGDLMKQVGGSFGGGETQANGMVRPAFGSANTVQSGGFGKYRSMIMGMI